MKKTMLLPVLILAASLASAQDLRVVGDEVDEEAGRPRAYFDGAPTQAGVLPVAAGSPSQGELIAELKDRFGRDQQLNREIPLGLRLRMRLLGNTLMIEKLIL